MNSFKFVDVLCITAICVLLPGLADDNTTVVRPLVLEPEEQAEILSRCDPKHFSTSNSSSKPAIQLSSPNKKFVPEGQYRFAGILMSNQSMVCSVVFVSPTYAITARNCLTSPRPGRLTLKAGGECYEPTPTGYCKNYYTNMFEVVIRAITYEYPSSSKSTSNLVLLHLKYPVPNEIRPFIDFVCLPVKGEPLPKEGTLFSFGRLDKFENNKYLQHVSAQVVSNSQTSLVFTVLLDRQVVPYERVQPEQFSLNGKNSVAGTGFVSYSEQLGRFVLHGIMTGEGWMGEENVLMRGEKIALHLGDFCRWIQLCMDGVDKEETVTNLDATFMPTKPAPMDKNSDEERVLDIPLPIHGKFCDRKSSSLPTYESRDIKHNNQHVYENGAFDNTEFYETFDEGTGKFVLNCSKDSNDTHICRSNLQYNLNKHWASSAGSKGESQLVMEICRNRKNFYLQVNYDSAVDVGILTTGTKSEWNLGEFNFGFIVREVNSSVTGVYLPNQQFIMLDKPCIRVGFLFNENFTEPGYGCLLENGVTLSTTENIDIALPFMKFAFGVEVDTIKLRIDSSNQGGSVEITSDFADPCFYKWGLIKESTCTAGEGNCSLEYTVDTVSAISTHSSREEDTEEDAAISSTEENRIKTETADATAAKSVKESLEEVSSNLQAQVSASAGVSWFVVSAKLSASLSATMSEKISNSMKTKVSEEFERVAGKELKEKLSKKKNLHTEINKLQEEINKGITSDRLVVKRTIQKDAKEDQEVCQLYRFCYGGSFQTEIINVFSKKNNQRLFRKK